MIYFFDFAEDDFMAVKNDLKTNDIYTNAEDVRIISNAHQIQIIIHDKFVIYDTSATGYN